MTSHQIQAISDLDYYLVGGAVRDKLLNIKSGDNDWVVVGTTEKVMLSLGFRPVGKGFPVFLHPETQEEYALARTEQKIDKGYKGFEVNADPTVTLEQDLYRRDLTINAMALDTDGHLFDPYGGKQDLENGVLRHVSKHFIEDPLRVLRVARFAARFHAKGFIIDETTLDLMREISESGELNHLVAERVWQELKIVLSEKNPSVFFKVLYTCGALETLFPEIVEMTRRKSETVWVIEYLDRAADLTNDIVYRFTVLTYLIGKIDGTEHPNVNAVTEFCQRLRTPASTRKLAERVAEFANQIMKFGQGSASEVVDLILSLEGLRNNQLFEQFLTASSVALIAVHRNSKPVERNIELLHDCRTQMRETDTKSLAAKSNSQQLRDSIRAAYIERVGELLQSSTTARPKL